MHGNVGDEWNKFWDDARAEPVEATSKRKGARLKGPRKERFGACPAGCAETDGFRVFPGTNTFLCRPSNASGDVVALAMHLNEFPDRIRAAEWLLGRQRPSGKARPETPEAAEARSTREAERKATADRRTEEREADERSRRARDRKFIDDTLARCVPLLGTHADDYLLARGIKLHERYTADLRFCSAVEYWGQASPEAENKTKLAELPAMVAKIRDVRGDVIGLHFTYLDPAEPRQWVFPPEAHLPKSERLNPAKKVRGEHRGGLIWLGEMGADVTSGEGIETTASAIQLFPCEGMSYAATINRNRYDDRTLTPTAQSRRFRWVRLHVC